MTTKNSSKTVPTFDSYREKVPLGQVMRDRQPSEKFPEGRIVLGIPTTSGGDQRGYMTVEEAMEQKKALVSTDPAHRAHGFRVTAKPVMLKVGDLFQVVGKMADQQVVNLNDNVKKYGDKRLPASEAIIAMPTMACITAWYEKKPTIKAHLKMGDKVRIGRKLYAISENGNDWIKLEQQGGR